MVPDDARSAPTGGTPERRREPRRQERGRKRFGM